MVGECSVFYRSEVYSSSSLSIVSISKGKDIMSHTLFRCISAFLLLLTLAVAQALADTTPGTIWIGVEKWSKLPITGPAWQQLKTQADRPAGTPNLSDQDQMNNVYVLAKALVYVRTGEEKYRTAVRQQLKLALDTELGGRTLALGRELAAYVIAADLIPLPGYDSTFDTHEFRPGLRRTLTETREGRTLHATHEGRPNNWGTHAGASRAAGAVYLGDTSELERTARVFRGFLGDRSAYASFAFGLDLSWQCDPARPVGLNPQGCRKNGHSLDGVLPDDQRRCGPFQWPPCRTPYSWEALQGVLVQAVILSRAGYDVWTWGNQAILRAVTWLQKEADSPAEGDDTWQLHLINFYYGTNFPAPIPARPGKNMGWTDWTHSRGGH